MNLDGFELLFKSLDFSPFAAYLAITCQAADNEKAQDCTADVYKNVILIIEIFKAIFPCFIFAFFYSIAGDGDFEALESHCTQLCNWQSRASRLLPVETNKGIGCLKFDRLFIHGCLFFANSDSDIGV